MNDSTRSEFRKSDKKYHIEIGFFQYNHEDERICGDVFLSKRVPEEKRVLCILSDGMGHGVKANILGTLTASISLNFTIEHKEAGAIAGALMKALPVRKENGISYATYTIVDITEGDETASILEYDNPQAVVMRGKKQYEPGWNYVQYIEDASDERNFDLKKYTFKPQLEDRIIFCSDGITQSGLEKGLATGWGRDNLIGFIEDTINTAADISAAALSEKIVKRASANDLCAPKDDMTCCVVYFREPRKTLLCTGPPFNMENDSEFARILENFNGKKIISGATTVEIISRELCRKAVDEEIIDNTLPPSSIMEGIDLVTEGVLTLGKAVYLLNNVKADSSLQLGKGPADRICKILLESDEIYILVGTKINEIHHDPSSPVEIEIRKNLIRRLADVLSEKFMKVVTIKYM